ncbi:MAG: response regulator [Parcubacteria group bacterium]|jgi:two-component system chemotaxis response regulator CheY
MAKILISDDSQFMRKILSDILTKNGFDNIIEAVNGEQALEKFKTEKPDLMLLDVIMPEKDGIEVVKEVVPQGAKVIMVSAVGQDDMIKQAKDLGVLGYIIKPFEEKQVIDEVKRALL